MKSISVIIPTANRPQFLVTALQSVARQTAVHEIEEVIVSENMGNRASQTVCENFPALPIRYLLQEPQLENVPHINALFEEAKAPLIALLCDDDWWSPGHLQNALIALHAAPKAAAFFATILYMASEADRQDVWIWRPIPFWLAAGMPDFASLWRLDLPTVLTTTWIVTPFSFSTMVARRDPLRAARPVFGAAQPYYADRILYPTLALHGDLLYDPLVDTFARWHAGNWMKDKSDAELTTTFREGCDKIRTMGLAQGLDPLSPWQSLLKTLPDHARQETGRYFRDALTDEQLRAFGFEEFIAPPTSTSPLSKLRRKAGTIKRRIVRE